MSQNAMRLQWTTEEVDNKLKVSQFMCGVFVPTLAWVYPYNVSIIGPVFLVLRKLCGSALQLHCWRPAILVATIRVRILLHANQISHVFTEYMQSATASVVSMSECWQCV